MKKPKVLIVEDDPRMQEAFKDALREEFEIFSALTVEQARTLFADHPDVDAIVFDFQLVGENTRNLVQEIRRIFCGQMIAASNVPAYSTLLLRAGCNCECDKGGVPKKLRELFAAQFATK